MQDETMCNKLSIFIFYVWCIFSHILHQFSIKSEKKFPGNKVVSPHYKIFTLVTRRWSNITFLSKDYFYESSTNLLLYTISIGLHQTSVILSLFLSKSFFCEVFAVEFVLNIPNEYPLIKNRFPKLLCPDAFNTPW